MTVIPYILYLLLVGLHVVVLDDMTAVRSAHLNLAAFLVMAVALYKEDVPATWFGFFVGLVAAVGRPEEAPFCDVTVDPAASFNTLGELFVMRSSQP
jgi:hypothetical protein